MTKAAERQAKQDVAFITSTTLPPGELRLHADLGDKILVRSLKSVKEDWAVITDQVVAIVGGSAGRMKSDGLALEEVSIGLAFTAKGKLAFIAEAGAEASITLTFKRAH